jgi:hypothetical protein
VNRALESEALDRFVESRIIGYLAVASTIHVDADREECTIAIAAKTLEVISPIQSIVRRHTAQSKGNRRRSRDNLEALASVQSQGVSPRST